MISYSYLIYLTIIVSIRVFIFLNVSGGHRATMTGGFDFQHGVSYIIVFDSKRMPKTRRFTPCTGIM